MPDTAQDLADLAEVWDTIHKTRTILLEISDTTEDGDLAARLKREVDFLERSQATLAKRLTQGGIGIDRFAGADSIVMPGAAKLSRVRAGNSTADD